MTRRSCIAIVVIAACGSPPRPPAANHVPPPSAPRSPSPCGGEEYVDVSVPPAPALDCDGRTCTATVPIAIHNCYAETIYVTALAGDKLRQPVAPNATWTTERTLDQVDLQIGVMVTLETYRYERWGEVTCTGKGRCTNRPYNKRQVMFEMRNVEINAVNYKLIAAKEACVACNGDWGQHTMMGDESCACRTKDKGRVCLDGADCEGFCEVFRFVVVKKRRTGDLGFAEGRCSEFVQRFSCTQAIPVGARAAGIGPERITTECVD